MGRAYNLMHKAVGCLLAPFVLSYCAFLVSSHRAFSDVCSHIFNVLHIKRSVKGAWCLINHVTYQRLMHRGRAWGAERLWRGGDFVRSVRARRESGHWSMESRQKVCFPRENVDWLFG